MLSLFSHKLNPMKKSILFAVLLSLLGCQAPKDRSGDAKAPPAANPQANDPKVKTQVEPRVIVLEQTPLILNTARGEKLNRMQKENLAEQSIEKTFTFTNLTDNTLGLTINGYSALDKKNCVENKEPVIKATVINEDGKSGSEILDLKRPLMFAVVKISKSVKLTILVTNPGHCRSLNYSFTVSTDKFRATN